MVARLVDMRWPLAAGFTLLLLLWWQWSGMREGAAPYVLPPTAVITSTIDLAIEGDLHPELLLSLRRQLTGFMIGATLGVVCGLLAGVVRTAEDFLDTLVSFTYPLPKIALFPVVVIWLGFTDPARVLIIALSCFYPSFVNAHAGTRTIDERYLWAARNFGANRRQVFRQIVFRAAMPSIAVGVRISLALSFILTFATETIGASRGGLGWLIEEGFHNRIFGWLYAGIFCFAILGFTADQIWMRTARRLLRGQRTTAVGHG